MIELSKTITFGQYINNGSALTRLDPRAKLLSAFLLILLFSYVANFTALALCLLCCIIVQWVSRIPVLYALRGFRLIVIFLSFLYILQVVFYTSPTQHTTLIWQWGIFTVSWEGIIRNALTIARILLLFYLASMLLFATSLVDLTDGSEALLSPLQKLGIPVNGLIMVLVIAFKFVPILVAEVERLIKAQTARGALFTRGNVVQRIANFGSLLVPLFVSGFRRAEALTIAMEARCYMGGVRGWRRSKRREMHFNRYDILALVFTIVFCIVTLIVNFVAPF
jgi:energy-coupling factor transport system permease protein